MVSDARSRERLVAPASGLARGAPIGRYMVLGLVGRGAMGEVYAAYDPELDRKVAVKLLHAEGGTGPDAAELKSRLLREAQAIARLSHPNVVVVHDVGSFGEQVFVAMEFVDGHTVSYWVHSGMRSWREIRNVFVAAGRGLAAAHAAHMVHRDFKGENVMLTDTGQVRVMDFGLARHFVEQTAPAPGTTRSGLGGVRRTPTAPPAPAAGAEQVEVITGPPLRDLGSTIPLPNHRACEVGQILESVEAEPPVDSKPPLSADLTQSGVLVGTPAYMAPEQFRGQAADARSDQFSFCVAMYESLYGERPFGGASVDELSENVRRGRLRPLPPSTRVPKWLRRVLLRGLLPQPNDRWPSMEALLAALERNPRARAWWFVAASAAVASAVVTTLALGLPAARGPTCQVPVGRFAGVWEPPGPGGMRRKAIADAMVASKKTYARESFASLARLLDGYVANWSAMYRDACEATNVRGEQSTEVLDLRMSCLRDRWNELRALSDVLVEGQAVAITNATVAATAMTPIERCADLSSLRSGLSPPGDPAVRRRVDDLRQRLVEVKALQDAGQYSRALADTVQIVAAARDAAYRPLIAEALNRLARLQLDTGHPQEADTNFEEALWIAEASSHDEVVTDVATTQIFVAGYIERDMPKARRWIRQAESFLERMGGHDLLRAWMLNNIGVVLDANGDREGAAVELFKALHIKERVLGKDHPDVSYTLLNLADTLSALGRHREALELSNRGVDIVGRSFGLNHPRLEGQLANRAEILNHLGRYDDARADAERAVEIHEAETGLEMNLIYALLPLGEAQLGLGQPERALAPLQRALRLAEDSNLEDVIPRLRLALARALWDSGGDKRRARALVTTVARPAIDAGPRAQTPAPLSSQAAAWLSTHQTP
jgi:serine/threonine protein kinase/tetratricopeptide (TPR) repeat protein